jgi:hypothetical protein
VIGIGTDLVAIFGGAADATAVDHLLDTVKDLSPEIAEITGIRQQAFEHGIDVVRNAYTGTIDLT